MLRLNGGFSVGTPVRMKVKIKRNLKMNRAPRMKSPPMMKRAPMMKSTMVTIRKILTMKVESLLKQDSSLLKQDSSQLKQGSVVACMTMTKIEWNLSEDITLYRSS